MAGKQTRTSERIPASIRVRLKYADEATFVRRYCANISRGGIFIATRAPKPIGTALRFEFQLARGEPLIRGEGSVVWVKPFDPAMPDQVHGMGVRFLRLDADSRRVIDDALAWKEKLRQGTAAAGGAATALDGDARPDSRDADDTQPANAAAATAIAPSPFAEPQSPRSVTIELEADEPTEEELRALHQQARAAEGDAAVSGPAAAGASSPVAASDDCDDEESGEIILESAPTDRDGAATSAPPAIRPVRAGDSGAVGADSLDDLVTEWGLSPDRVAAQSARARSQVAALAETPSSDDELDRLLEPARPEPLPDAAQARQLLARLIGDDRDG